MPVIVFDEDGPHFLGDLTPSQLHSAIAISIGEPPNMPVVSSKEAANYTPRHGSSTEWCAICQFWTMGPLSNSPGLCHVVAGEIDPDGWCRYFRHVQEAAE